MPDPKSAPPRRGPVSIAQYENGLVSIQVWQKGDDEPQEVFLDEEAVRFLVERLQRILAERSADVAVRP